MIPPARNCRVTSACFAAHQLNAAPVAVARREGVDGPCTGPVQPSGVEAHLPFEEEAWNCPETRPDARDSHVRVREAGPCSHAQRRPAPAPSASREATHRVLESAVRVGRARSAHRCFLLLRSATNEGATHGTAAQEVVAAARKRSHLRACTACYAEGQEDGGAEISTLGDQHRKVRGSLL